MATVTVDVHSQAKETTTKEPKIQDSEEIVGQSPDEPQHPPPPPSKTESEDSHGEDALAGAGEGVDEAGVDLISSLPDAILGEILFLLPTKSAARTQALSSRWRHVWRCSPLNIDHTCLSATGDALVAFITRTIAAHQGSVRRLSVPERFFYHRTSDVKAWLRSLALDNLHELEFFSAPMPRFRYTKPKTLPRLRRELLGSPTPPYRK